MRFEQLIGLRADEMHRIKDFKPTYARSTVRFPLMEDGITKQDVNNYWISKPYTLEIPPILGNCTCCFLKGQAAIITIFQQYPELAASWIGYEKQVQNNKITAGLKNIKAQFFPNMTFEQLLTTAQTVSKQFDINQATPAYGCSCTS